MRLVALKAFAGSFGGLMRHRPFKMAAALSYYAALSLAPLLVIVLAVAGIALERSTMIETVVGEMERVLGRSVGDLVRALVDEEQAHGKGVLATVLGGIAMLFAATGVFAELQDDLDIVWGVAPRIHGNVLAFLRHRLLSLAMVGGIGFLLLISFVVNSALAFATGPLRGVTGGEALVGGGASLLVTLAGTSVFFALIFKVLPDVRIPLRHVWPGAIATSLLFVLGQFAIGAYLGRTAIGSTYGAAGSLVLVLVWVYYSSLIVLFGAEFTRRVAVGRGYVGMDNLQSKGVPVEPRASSPPRVEQKPEVR